MTTVESLVDVYTNLTFASIVSLYITLLIYDIFRHNPDIPRIPTSLINIAFCFQISMSFIGVFSLLVGFVVSFEASIVFGRTLGFGSLFLLLGYGIYSSIKGIDIIERLRQFR